MKYIFTLLLLFPLFIFSQVQIGQDIDGEAIGDNSGSSVSLSSDGKIVAIGATGNNGVNGENSGHVRVFENVSGSWVQIGSDIDGETDHDYEGNSVSLSSDGSVLAICHQRYNPVSGENSGHIRVFENQSGNWVQIWIETGDEPEWDYEYDNYGYSVSLSDDGSVIAFGKAGLDGNNVIQSGFVRVFKNLFGNYIQIGSDINNEVTGDRFGYSVSLSSDGSVVAIGAIGQAYTFNEVFSSYVSIYQNLSGNWIQIGSDINNEVIGDRFGYSVSLSSDGSIVAIGAISNDGNGENSGHVRIYENQNNTWVQIGQDIDGEATGDRSGSSVSLSSDGSVVAIGAHWNDGITIPQLNDISGENSGHVRIYENQNNTWVQIGQDIDGEATGDRSGSSVSLSSDGSVVAIGAQGNNGVNGEDSGHVRVYDLTEALSVDENSLIKFNLFPNPAYTSITIEVPKNLEIKTIAIYNNLGQLVTKTTKSIVDVSSLSSGVYLVEIETIEGRATKKLIIE
ncbi:T9SS type A sorting domain-containing protein [Hanstruepera ponticola]|uniref:T9SS type A sorting domain-containing protein n=1 Tax=Hanstruepera ponticola TaxID=2042995 RepID=UPI000CF0F158|nr:T9SS type A sorting domain-containing protein [Hanstruepera ponticola]